MRRRITSVSVGLLLSLSLVGAPAGAHGALQKPLSRAAACGADSPLKTRPAACRAAVVASGKAMPADWDNLRVANVAGKDREVIPDGKLCSGGIPEFKGLEVRTYVIKGRLPSGRTGRHLIYTIWQNSDTPDTYYSCSDVIFRTAAAVQARPRPVAYRTTGYTGIPWLVTVAALCSIGAGAMVVLMVRPRRRQGHG
ncbi:lytic polysaccharide monooxygenase [Nonomuraea helvata]|uniref:Lytic polysaccharide monooxygenase n=1 Tax=Nonomuraea helvata TaxID=37484 RepID=A0ABV5S4E3_9ACTN